MHQGTLYKRLKSGWSIEKALTTQKQIYRKKQSKGEIS
jgi:hypothetical protein